MSNPLKVYPSAIELSKVATNVTCPEEGCTNVFASGSNLNLHLVKIHKKSHLQPSDNTKKEFHCPEMQCIYHDKLFFKTLKLLKQHFLKVHGEKMYSCESCDKGFSTEAARRSHTEYCGIKFHCCDCEVSYNCYETLKTHGRRKKHSVLDKVAYKSGSVGPVGSQSDDKLILKQQVLLPKTSQSITLLVKPIEIRKQIDQLDKCLQTDFIPEAPKPAQKSLISAETQTTETYEPKKSPQNNELPDDRKTNTNTQTDTVYSKSQSCNTSFNLNDLDLNDIERSSSSTQTCAGNLDFDDTNFFNCNSETQTDLMFQGEMFNVCDYYSHMYTQTCEDFLLDEMGFSDTHTQTAFEDAAKNVESQTICWKKNALGCRDMASMETQTDLEFKQMLEEINA